MEVDEIATALRANDCVSSESRRDVDLCDPDGDAAVGAR